MTLCAFMFSTQAATRYVDAAATGAGDGTSWSDAYTTIAAALTASSSGDEIWVKAGTYSISVTLAVKSGISVYGGFAGTEPTIADRTKSDLDGNGIVEPWEFTNATVVKGDLTKALLNGAAPANVNVWNGMTFTNGLIKNGSVVPVLVSANVKLEHSIIRNNSTSPTNLPTGTMYAGALQVSGGVADGCLIENNYVNAVANATYGAAVGVEKSGILKNSVVRNNQLVGTGTNGRGTVFINSGGMAINCLIYNNYNYRDGGGVYLENAASIENGKGYTSPYTALVNSTVVNNTAGNAGGGVRVNLNTTNNQRVYNNVVWGNKLGNGNIDNLSGSATNYSGYNAYNAGSTTFPNGVQNITNLAAANADGPRFVQPTTFVGLPTTPADSILLRQANWSIVSGSALTDKGSDTISVIQTILKDSTDILGNSRNIACTPAIKKWDIGAYEFQKAVATFTWTQDFSGLNMGSANVTLTATLSNGDNSSIVYTTDDPLVATIENGNELKIEGAGTANVTASYLAAGSYACPQAKAITVSSSYTPSLSLSADTLKVAATAGLDSVAITSNSPFSITNTLAAWLTPDKTSGNAAQSGANATDKVKFTITANPTPLKRYAKVLFSSGGLLDSVIVEQAAGAATFSLSKTTSSLAFNGLRADGKADTVYVTSNTPWTVSKGSASWLTVTPASGSGNESGQVVTTVVLSATAQAYPDPERNATLTFTPAGYGSTPTATVTQAAAPAPGYIFVDGGKADDSGDGKSWANAKKTIAAALTAATASRDTVLVKAGTYTITATLAAVEGVNVYGGFAGTEVSTTPRARVNAKDAPWAFVNSTILDANGAATRILSSSAFNTLTCWDGFTLQNAKAVASNGSAADLKKNMVLNNCILQNNSTSSAGAAAALMTRDAGLHNSLVKGNEGGNGPGGVYINGGITSGDQTTISGCHFIENVSKTNANGGGAISNYFGGTPSGTFKISGCYFARNAAVGGNAAAVFSNTAGTSVMLLEDCIFTEHTVATNTAPCVLRCNNGLALNRCKIINNNFSTAGNVGIVFFNGRGGIYNSVIANNSMRTGVTQGYALYLNAATAEAVGNTIVRNDARDLAGNAGAKLVNNISQDNTFPAVYKPAVALTNVYSGVTFRQATNAAGAAATPEQARAIANADWRTANATAVDTGTNLTAAAATYLLGDLLLKDAYAQSRPASGAWTIGAYQYNASLAGNTITWTQTLALDMNGTGNPKEMPLTATATAAGAVTYTVDNPQVAYVENGNVLKSFSPGSTTVRANHGGDATHSAASEVALDVSVSGDPSTLALSAYTLPLVKLANSVDSITLTSNYGYILTYKSPWISVNPESANEASSNRVVKLTATSANPYIVPRVDSVIFLSGGLKQKLVITQAAGDATLSATPATVTLSALEGASATFSIASNTSWLIAGAAPWVNLSTSSGTGNAIITATVLQENTDTLAGRTLTLVVSATGVANDTVVLSQQKALPPTILYVAQSGDGSDGSTWAKAHQTIGAALAAANNGDKIFVKAGTYGIATALRSKAGVRVYGGFAGTESSVENRIQPANAKAWEFSNPTILEPAAGTRVIDTTMLSAPAIWDGFTMQGARHITTKEDSARVGGIAYLRKNTFINNSILRNNVTYTAGAAIYMDVDARVYNSLLDNNHTLYASGGAVSLASITGSSNYTPLVGNAITNNRAHAGAGVNINFPATGAVYTGTVTLFNNYFAYDSAELRATTDPSQVGNGGGGALFLNIGSISTVIIDSCTFKYNLKATELASGGSPGGGAIRTQGAGGTTIINRSVFVGNRTVDGRGASAVHTNDPNYKLRIYNSLFQGNTGGAEAVQLRGGHMINNTVIGNNGAGIGFIDKPEVVLNNVVRGNTTNLNPATANPSNYANVTFVDSAAGNFRLKLYSPGVDKGVVVGILQEPDPVGREMLKKDFGGVARPQGASYDPGMYEYVKVRPSASAGIAWTQDLSSLNISTTEQVKLTASVTGVTGTELSYLSPAGYISGDDLTVSVAGDTLILMGTGTTTLTAHTKVNPYYDTIAVAKQVTVTGSDFLAVLPTSLSFGMLVADSVLSFKLNTDKAWSTSNVPAWLSLSQGSGSAGRAEVWVSVVQDNSLSAPRSATFTVATSTKSRSITVKQDGLIFSISTTEISLADIGDSKDFYVDANLLWRADFEADSAWATVSPDNGAKSATVYVTPQDNLGPERTGQIKVYTERSGVPTYTITVVQAGVDPQPNAVGKQALTAFIYPNPTSDVFYVSTSEDLKGAQLQIFNLSGALVLSQPWSGLSQSVNVRHLPSGAYLMMIKDADGKTLSAKIIKQ